MISTSSLTKSFGDRTLFEGVSLQLNAGERYGLVGANGSGRTCRFVRLDAFPCPACGRSLVRKLCDLTS